MAKRAGPSSFSSPGSGRGKSVSPGTRKSPARKGPSEKSRKVRKVQKSKSRAGPPPPHTFDLGWRFRLGFPSYQVYIPWLRLPPHPSKSVPSDHHPPARDRCPRSKSKSKSKSIFLSFFLYILYILSFFLFIRLLFVLIPYSRLLHIGHTLHRHIDYTRTPRKFPPALHRAAPSASPATPPQGPRKAPARMPGGAAASARRSARCMNDSAAGRAAKSAESAHDRVNLRSSAQPAQRTCSLPHLPPALAFVLSALSLSLSLALALCFTRRAVDNTNEPPTAQHQPQHADLRENPHGQDDHP